MPVNMPFLYETIKPKRFKKNCKYELSSGTSCRLLECFGQNYLIFFFYYKRMKHMFLFEVWTKL